jgi:hypothetical protein
MQNVVKISCCLFAVRDESSVFERLVKNLQKSAVIFFNFEQLLELSVF